MRLDEFDFYALGDAARALGVSNSMVGYMSRDGRIKTLRASDGTRLFDKATIEKMKRELAKQAKTKAA